MKHGGLFGLSEDLKRLSAFGDPLEELGRVIDFEGFRPILEGALDYSDGSKVHRPPGPFIGRRRCNAGEPSRVVGPLAGSGHNPLNGNIQGANRLTIIAPLSPFRKFNAFMIAGIRDAEHRKTTRIAWR